MAVSGDAYGQEDAPGPPASDSLASAGAGQHGVPVPDEDALAQLIVLDRAHRTAAVLSPDEVTLLEAVQGAGLGHLALGWSTGIEVLGGDCDETVRLYLAIERLEQLGLVIVDGPFRPQGAQVAASERDMWVLRPARR